MSLHKNDQKKNLVFHGYENAIRFYLDVTHWLFSHLDVNIVFVLFVKLSGFFSGSGINFFVTSCEGKYDVLNGFFPRTMYTHIHIYYTY